MVLSTYMLLAVVFNTLTPIMVVSSGSMDPTLRYGDIIIARGGDVEVVEVGDIIAFNVPSPYDRTSPSPVIHRVVRKWVDNGVTFFRTRGDANPVSDPYNVPANNIVGKYTGLRVPYLGLALLSLKSPITWILIILIVAFSVMFDHLFRRR